VLARDPRLSLLQVKPSSCGGSRWLTMIWIRVPTQIITGEGGGVEQEGPVSSPRAFRDILIVGSPILVLGAVGNVVGSDSMAGGAIINLGYVLMIILGGYILGRQGGTWREIGLVKIASWRKTAWCGVGSFLAAVVLFLAVQSIAMGLLAALGQAPAAIDQSRFDQMEGNLSLFMLLVVLAWTTIAFGEELYYRAFLISRLTDHSPIGQGWAIMIAGAIFGAAHFAEGPLGILSNGAFGVLFGWIYVRCGRNLWITIIGHGLINTLRFTMLYLGAA
jgi:membrane protease YdiL (CAAX protease family)